MALTIWKYEVESAGTTVLDMPIGARVLSVQVQAGVPTLWALVDSAKDLEQRTFVSALTGGAFHARIEATFIGTVQLHRGTYVAHVFEMEGR